MAVKRYDGSAWQTVAGLGAQGQAATSSSIATWVKTATGGETSVSGNDDNSQPLSYTVGQELVFINGALQKRGADYTATTGNSITGLTALAANDVVTVWTVNAFSVTGAIANSIVDAKGDLIVATGADTPGRLAVGTNGQVLTAASTTGTGLAWTTPTPGALVKITNTSFSNVASQDFDGVFTSTYKDYLVVVNSMAAATNTDTLWMRLKYGSTVQASQYYQFRATFTNTATSAEGQYNQIELGRAGSTASVPKGCYQINLHNIDGTAQNPSFYGMGTDSYTNYGYFFGGGWQGTPTAFDGFRLLSSSSNITGDVTVYGVVR